MCIGPAVKLVTQFAQQFLQLIRMAMNVANKVDHTANLQQFRYGKMLFVGSDLQNKSTRQYHLIIFSPIEFQ